jgi:CBS domain-containing protein
MIETPAFPRSRDGNVKFDRRQSMRDWDEYGFVADRSWRPRHLMFDQPVRTVMEQRRIVKAAPHASVASAARLMLKNSVGAVLVMKRSALIGIFTERDIAFRVVARGLDPIKTRLASVMTSAPETIEPEKPLGSALLRMHEGGFRHLPVVHDGKVLGMVSARNAMDPELEEYAFQEDRRKHYRSRL